MFNTLFFIITLALILWVIKNNRNDNDPLVIAKQRYAQGEITKKEYQELIKELR